MLNVFPDSVTEESLQELLENLEIKVKDDIILENEGFSEKDRKKLQEFMTSKGSVPTPNEIEAWSQETMKGLVFKTKELKKLSFDFYKTVRPELEKLLNDKGLKGMLHKRNTKKAAKKGRNT